MRPKVGRNAALAFRTFSTDHCALTGREFIRKVKALGKDRGLPVRLDTSRGKGSHQTYFGSVFTVVRNPKVELKTGTFHAMCANSASSPTIFEVHHGTLRIRCCTDPRR
ncbi:MAG: hypothetical protein ACYC97_11655 [Metallibacterium sp.]